MQPRMNECIVWIFILFFAVLSSEVLMAHVTAKSDSGKTSNDAPSGKKSLPAVQEPQFRTEEKISEMEEGNSSMVNPLREKEHNVQTAEELKDLKEKAKKGKPSTHNPFQKLPEGN
jgi:hypothetical protein